MIEVPENYRPPKFKRRKIRKWQPGVWQPEYEMIVSESILGVANTALATKYGYDVVHISNILNTEEARKRKAEAVEIIKRNSLDNLTKSLGNIQERALKNVEQVLSNQDLAQNKPFEMLAASIQALKGVGTFKGDGGGVVVNNNNTAVDKALINLGPEQQQTFLEGLDKANKAIILHKDVTGDSIK